MYLIEFNIKIIPCYGRQARQFSAYIDDHTNKWNVLQEHRLLSTFRGRYIDGKFYLFRRKKIIKSQLCYIKLKHEIFSRGCICVKPIPYAIYIRKEITF